MQEYNVAGGNHFDTLVSADDYECSPVYIVNDASSWTV